MRSLPSLSRRSFVNLAIGIAGAPFVSAEEPKPVVPDYNKMSDDEEVKLGREAAEGIEKEKKLSLIEIPEIHKYVDTMFQKIAKSSRRPNLPYSIKIVDTKEVNAFALPGGFTYVNRGLLEWARTEAELVSVLGHEVGHVVGRHGANMISRMNAAQSLLTEASKMLLGSDSPAKILMNIGGPLALLAMLKYSRTQELEADLFGYYNIQRAGWHPQGMVDLFKHFGDKATALDPLFSIVQSHPVPAEREEQIRAEMKKFPPKADLANDSEQFKAVQARLKKLPPPKVVTKLLPE